MSYTASFSISSSWFHSFFLFHGFISFLFFYFMVLFHSLSLPFSSFVWLSQENWKKLCNLLISCFCYVFHLLSTVAVVRQTPLELLCLSCHLARTCRYEHVILFIPSSLIWILFAFFFPAWPIKKFFLWCWIFNIKPMMSL